jgi:hypothetical protein
LSELQGKGRERRKVENGVEFRCRYEHTHSVNEAGNCYQNVIWKNSVLKSYCALVKFEFQYFRKHLSCVVLEINSCLSYIKE